MSWKSRERQRHTEGAKAARIRRARKSTAAEREPMRQIDLGVEDDGTSHLLYARRNLNHTATPRCGCNPDAANDGISEWWWHHHPFDSELGGSEA